MEREPTFSHIGAEASQLLMKIAKKSHVQKHQYCQNDPLFSPRSNDNKDTVKSARLQVAGLKG